MVVSHLPNGPTAYFTLADVVMRHDIPGLGTMSEQFPHLIFHNFKTPLGERVRLDRPTLTLLKLPACLCISNFLQLDLKREVSRHCSLSFG